MSRLSSGVTVASWASLERSILTASTDSSEVRSTTWPPRRVTTFTTSTTSGWATAGVCTITNSWGCTSSEYRHSRSARV